jgi:hypothetical protein
MLMGGTYKRNEKIIWEEKRKAVKIPDGYKRKEKNDYPLGEM